MRCPACRNQCMDTDIRCPHCQHNLVNLEPETQLSPASVCGLIFAAVGAGIVALVPLPEGIEINQFALAGVGAVVGGVVGAAIGFVIDRRSKKSKTETELIEEPSPPTNQSSVG